MASIGNRAIAKVLVAIAALSGCAPAVPGLEETLLPAASGAGSRGVAGQPLAVGRRPANDPAWDPRIRIPNTNPRVLTNNAYGPGRSSDIYGRVVYHSPGLQIEETALGAGDYRDQYGRPVNCYGSGMGTFCR